MQTAGYHNLVRMYGDCMLVSQGLNEYLLVTHRREGADTILVNGFYGLTLLRVGYEGNRGGSASKLQLLKKALIHDVG